MKKLILKTRFSLGDVVMMTAAVRDLHRCYPNRFVTDVRTHYPEIWENNPHITYLEEKDPEVVTIDCRYPLISHANFRPYHCLHGYISFLNSELGLQICPTEFRGDIHLAPEEKEWASQVHELTGRDIPFWLISAGGKYDITIKWWASERYQRVVDYFRGKIAFVQIGQTGHHHPPLRHAIDLRGQTSVRELIRLVYHAQGCLCSVTGLMHLAAAIETKPGYPPNRPCVVVAGGREPSNWEAYPHHQFLHTVGALSCCRQGGCWKCRTVPLGDGDDRDEPDSLCTDVVAGLPRCMDMITPSAVIEGVAAYFKGGAIRYLEEREVIAAKRGVLASKNNSYDEDSLSRQNSVDAINRAIEALPRCSRAFKGRGIVICGGGLKYFPCAWICINMLRYLGCRMPIEFWYMGHEEMDEAMLDLLRPLDVQPVNAREIEKTHPRRTSGGWELKSYAIIHSAFKEVLLLDADNVPIKDPSFLFEEARYKNTGSIFWPDYGCLAPDRKIWGICGIPYRNESEFETGQIVVHKEKCWRALNLALWFNEHSDFYYEYIHGDKETFHLAWRKLNQPYTMIPHSIKSLDGIMCQHDLRGHRIFQHRNTHKWKAFAPNVRVKGFLYENLCLQFLKQLEERWDGRIDLALRKPMASEDFIFRGGTSDRSVFYAVCEKNEYDLPDQFRSTDVIIDIGAHIGSFSYACLKRGAKRILAFEPESQNFKLAQRNLHKFKGSVRLHQRAVWRSDRHPGLLLHSGYPENDAEINTGGGTVLIEGEKRPDHKRKELVPTISLDMVLKRFKQVRLLKLDCEGSEWPILLTSKLLGKVESICGEYHELKTIPTPALVSGFKRYTKKELAEFLRRHYKEVRIQSFGTGNLGHFWANTPITDGMQPRTGIGQRITSLQHSRSSDD